MLESFEEVVVATIKAELLTSISDATGGGTVTATIVLRVVTMYALPDDLSCTDIVTAYATATGVAADSVSASCDPALRRSLLAQEVEITTTFSATEAAAADALIEIDPIAAMSVELGVEPTEIAQTAATVAAIDAEWFVAITDADTADLDTRSIAARVSGAVDEVAIGAGAVAETSDPVDVTPLPPPPPAPRSGDANAESSAATTTVVRARTLALLAASWLGAWWVLEPLSSSH